LRDTRLNYQVSLIKTKIKKIMNEKLNPWDMVYELYKDTYTKEEVDEMLMCELTELIQKYNTN
jgi:hypothetical protein